MGARGSALSRAVGFFRTATLDEARAAKIIVDEVMARRLRDENLPVPEVHKRPRRKRVASPTSVSTDPNAAYDANIADLTRPHRKHVGEPAPRQMTVEEGIRAAERGAVAGADLG